MERSIYYKLHLIRIECYISDEGDADEIFIKFNGKKIWPQSKFVSMKENEALIDMELKVEKGSVNILEVWDYDFLSSNDLLGTVEITADQAGGSYTVEARKGSNTKSRYGISYELL